MTGTRNLAHWPRRLLALLAVPALLWAASPAHAEISFDSGPVRPVAMSPDGKRLYTVNTPNNTLEIFDLAGKPLVGKAYIELDEEPERLLAVSLAPPEWSERLIPPFGRNSAMDATTIVPGALPPLGAV